MFPFIAMLLSLSEVPPPEPNAFAASGIAGSRGGVLALWDDASVRLTRDGVAFSPALAGKARVEAVAVADDGTVYVARAHGRLGVRAPDGHERWRAIPDAKVTRALFVAGQTIVWLGERRGVELSSFMVSKDGGAHFSERPRWQVGNFDNRVALTSDGAIQLIGGSEAPCGGGNQERFFGTVDSQVLTPAPWGMDAPVDYVPGAAGFAYVPDECGRDEGHAICVVTKVATDPTPLALPAAPPLEVTDWPYLAGVTDGRRTWLAAGRTLFVATGANARVLSTEIPIDAIDLALAGDDVWVRGEHDLYVFHADTWRRVVAR